LVTIVLSCENITASSIRVDKYTVFLFFVKVNAGEHLILLSMSVPFLNEEIIASSDIIAISGGYFIE